MSVILRQSWTSGGPKDESSGSQQLATLLNLRTLLQRATDQAPDPGGKTYEGVVILAQAIINAALNDSPLSGTYRALACQTSTVALSIISGFQDLIPDLNHLTDRDRQYVDALLIDVATIRQVLRKVHETVVSILGSPQSNNPTYSGQLSLYSKRLQALLDAFELKASNFMTDPELAARRGNGVPQANGDGYDLAWSDVDLKQACQTPHPPVWDENLQKFIPTETFWDDTFEATVRGRAVVVKTYSAFERFQRELDILKARRHSNLPSLFGHSESSSSTPFIVMSTRSFIPFFEYLPQVCSQTPGTAVEDTWKMLVSMRSAAEFLLNHLVMTSPIFDNSSIEIMRGFAECLEAAVVDSSGKVILPPTMLRHEVGRVQPVEQTQFLWLMKSVPSRVVGIFFSYNVPGRNSRQQDVDRLPILLRPLRWAVSDDPSEVLHSSHARLRGTRYLESAIINRRPDPSKRDLSWPLDLQHTVSKWAVGDIGRFLISATGTPSFEYYENIQDLLGGYWMTREDNGDVVEHKGNDGMWKPPPTSPTRLHMRCAMSVAPGIALNILSTYAQSIAEKRGVLAEELVLITESSHTFLFPNGTSEFPNFTPFDEQGRLFSCYQQNGADPMPTSTNSLTPRQGFRRLVSGQRYVQIEEDELKLSESQQPPAFLRILALGDIGYYARESDGRRFFHLAGRGASEDIVGYHLQPWERNDCEQLGDGIWRSPFITTNNETKHITYSWGASAWTGLPYDLKLLYIYWLATEQGRSVLEASDARKVQMIYQVTHQIRAILWQHPDRPPLRLFIHFNNQSRPVRAYWSQDDKPDVIPLNSPPWLGPGCEVSIMANISSNGEPSFGGSLRQFYRLVTAQGQVQSQKSQNTPKDLVAGDVGYWEQVSGGQRGGRWIRLNNIGFRPIGRSVQLELSKKKLELECSEVSNGLWRIQYRSSATPITHSQTSTDQSVEFDLRWVERLAPLPSEFGKSLPKESDSMALKDIRIVTKIITEVHGSAPIEELHQRKLFMFVYFPPQGGCYAYWSQFDHSYVNARALSKLDLEGWQVPGCRVAVNATIERQTANEVSCRLMLSKWQTFLSRQVGPYVQDHFLLFSLLASILTVLLSYYVMAT